MEHKKYKKVVLVIFDGFGVASSSYGNAIAQAKTPALNFAISNYPSLTLQASGPLVGLPWGEMGNSEVGHLNIGAGRIVGQDLPRITRSIQTGEFFKNPAFLSAIEHCKKNNSALHLIGLLSPGGVHSLDEHLYALLGLAESKGLKKVYIHMFTDGRDTDEKIALETLKKARHKIAEIGVGEIATIAGRFYAMDRGGHWDQTLLTYQALVEGKGIMTDSAESCIENNYSQQIYDEMIKPSVIVNEMHEPVGKISDNDAVIYFNFRQDRALQLTQSFVQMKDVPEKFRGRPLQNLFFVTMTEYAQGLPAQVAYPPLDLKNNLGEVLSNSKYTQFHIAESEKYAHVTSFFNCGRTAEYPGEKREIITSPENSHNYVDHPEMSSEKLTDVLTKQISSSDFNFFVANFANTDMVGHTGNLKAAILAVEFLDSCFKKIMNACLLCDAALFLTADHGNVEQMINLKTGDIDKDHTTNPVPFLMVLNEFKFRQSRDLSYVNLAGLVPEGVICDVAPTVLDLFGIDKPAEMTGVSLLKFLNEEEVKK
jgi:2,3-bisphosphoglycerate-independent phosphoglycerate mutase